MHPTLSAQDVADFVADFVADPSPRTWSEAYGLWRQTGPTVRGQTCATGGSACSRVRISEGERRGRARGEHGGCDTGGKGS